MGPHSLGKLIEWKRYRDPLNRNLPGGPHSLGKLIEWKRTLDQYPHGMVLRVPTRWGN